VSHLRAISLFSNCGAGDVGYRLAGFRFDVMAEIDPRRLEVCLLNHPGAVGVPGDLRDTWPKVAREYRRRAGNQRPALLCACPPCQGMSSARSGKGCHADADAGSRDERNLLVTVIGKVALRLKPSIIVVENVLAFLTRKVRHPKDDEPISAANYLIAALAKDYVVFPLVDDLCNYGIPQSRMRAFLTFVRRDLSGLRNLLRLARAPYPRPTHGQAHGNLKSISLNEALASFGLPDLDAAKPEDASAEGFCGFHAVPVWDERTYAMVAAIPRGSGRSAWENDECFRCGTVDVAPTDVTCPKCGDALLRPVVREADGSFRLIKGFKTSYRRMFGDRPAATITTASGHIGSDYTIHPTQTRLLSTLECAWLQTFPRSFAWGDALKKWGHTNVRDMIGEAVPPAFTRLHGQVLLGILRKEWTRAPISLSDDPVTRAWTKLVEAAKSDGRRDPRTYVSYIRTVPGGATRRPSPIAIR
jgi:DNA (cytosine-5)-methyltransferase 1